MTAAAALAPSDTAFFGQPRGVGYLAFTEAWERFSYYGMTALVVLYMTQELLLPGHIGHIAGFAGFRAGIESVVGPLSTQALASQIYGLYTGLVYFTPVFGGMLADRWLGARRTVMLGALLLAAGHLAMAFDASFLLALALLIVGTGCLKGNISAQVGSLYPREDDAGRTRGYTIFSMGVNVGATVGPLGCGLLAELYGWHWGFGAAGALMLVGLFTYALGMRHLPPDPPRRRRRAAGERVRLTGTQWRIVGLLLVAIMLTVFQTIAYNQCFNVGLVWIDAHVDAVTPLGRVPTAWFNSIDAFTSVVVVPLLFALWAWQARHGGEPADIAKIGTGAAIGCVAALLFAGGARLAGDGRCSALWPLAGLVLMGVAFDYYWPPLLALVSRAAPAPVNSTMMGVAFLSLFVGNVLMGWLGGLYEPLGPTRFWLLHAGIAATGAILALILNRPLTRALTAPR